MSTDTHCLTDKQTFWRTHLERCGLRRISLARYAREEGLNVQSLYSWKQFFAKKMDSTKSALPPPRASSFIRARVATPVTFSRILLPNGVSIEVAHDVDVLLLEQLASLRIPA